MPWCLLKFNSIRACMPSAVPPTVSIGTQGTSSVLIELQANVDRRQARHGQAAIKDEDDEGCQVDHTTP